MTQGRSVFLTVLAIVFGLTGLYLLFVLLLTLLGSTPLELKGILTLMDADLARTIAIVFASVMSILFLVSAYGLWVGRTWGRWLVALIIAFDILVQGQGKSMVGFFSLTVGEQTAKIDLGMLFEVVLLVAVLSLPRTSASLAAPFPPWRRRAQRDSEVPLVEPFTGSPDPKVGKSEEPSKPAPLPKDQ